MPKALSKRVSDFFHFLDKNSDVSQPLTEREKSLAEKHPNLYKFVSIKRTNDRQKAIEQCSSKYRPWSKVDLLTRLSTYSYRLWDIPEKLTKISPLECAKRGWSCYSSSNKNTIRCALCGSVIQLNLGKNEDIYKNMETAYHEMLITEHKNNCPWKEKWCNDDIYEISAHDYWKQTKLGYYSLETALLVDENFTDREKDYIRQAENMVFLSEKPEKINKAALKYALQGWKSFQAPSIIRCELCFATVDGSQSSSISKHRVYCPFKDFWPSRMSSLLRVETAAERTEDERPVAERIQKLREIYFKKKV